MTQYVLTSAGLLRGRQHQAYLTFLAVVLVVLRIVVLFVIVRLIAVASRDADLPDEDFSLLLVH